MDLKLEEKRRFPRIKLKVPLYFRIRGEQESQYSLSDDVSVGGLAFVNEQYIPPETNLMLELKILSQVINPIGRIAWISPLAHANRYRLGVEFLELGLAQKNYLSDYIEMQKGSF